MWISFTCQNPYAIKVFIGGVNAVSGEPAVENAATRLRRRARLAQNQSVQDYLVVPEQRWIDGIATANGKVRQFVAMPMGSGYSVEAQVTGEEVTGGIQFEITPLLCRERFVNIQVKTLAGKIIPLTVSLDDTADDIKLLIKEKEGLVPDQFKLIHAAKIVEG
jgi:Ubiquitin family